MVQMELNTLVGQEREYERAFRKKPVFLTTKYI
jgi:hypothetical protein